MKPAYIRDFDLLVIGETFVEINEWNIAQGYRQYRGWRCAVCDEPMGL